jgi:hypothetical protein
MPIRENERIMSRRAISFLNPHMGINSDMNSAGILIISMKYRVITPRNIPPELNNNLRTFLKEFLYLEK